MRRALAVVALAAAVASVVPKATADVPPADHVQVLAINDFHGALEAENGAPGAAALATGLRDLRHGRKRSVTVGAGDLTGGSPLTSAFQHDGPTLDALAAMGMRFSAVGNHEFDEGVPALRRLAGEHALDWLAANVLEDGETVFPPVRMERFGAIRVGFLGLTLEDTPAVVAPGGTMGLQFLDEAETANRHARELERRGADAVFVLLHEGGKATGGANGCAGFGGAAKDVVGRLSDRIDAVATAHTHDAYVCRVGGKVVASAGDDGRYVTDWDLAFDRRTGRLQGVEAENVAIDPDNRPDPAVQAIVERAKAAAAPLADRVVGRLGDGVSKADTDELVAEAMLAATRPLGAQAALMNPGGVRTGLPEGDVTYGDAFGALPFGYDLVVRTYTGAQLEETLGGDHEIARTANVETDPLTIDGRMVGPGDPVRVVVNEMLAAGNDGFPALGEGTDEARGPGDIEALSAYLADGR
jgi:5'-nucleotidase